MLWVPNFPQPNIAYPGNHFHAYATTLEQLWPMSPTGEKNTARLPTAIRIASTMPRPGRTSYQHLQKPWVVT